MCGRIAQYNHPLRYTEFLGIENAALMFDRADQRLGFNVAPGCHPVVVFPDGSLRRVHWGYRPPWAAERGLPHTLNARVESAAEQPYFRSLWRHGRVIVPVDGWYEWRIELGRKQAYYIRLQADAPMFVAALTNFQEGKVSVDDVGLVIVTAAPDTGLIDVHDRRPLVLSTADACRWLDASEPIAAIKQLAQEAAVKDDHFTWYPVSNAIEKITADSADLIRPLPAICVPPTASAAS